MPRIAISMGDPFGIGPEVTVKALADPEIARLARYVVAGEEWLLRQTAAQLGLPAPGAILSLGVLPPEGYRPGRLEAVGGRAAIAYIRAAAQLCLQGEADAMTTGPVNKEAVTRAGIPFTGHTEYIAELCGAEESRMLLVNDRLRVVHVTTHVGLRQACQVEMARVLQTIRLGHQAARRLGIASPRIAVCGLNPHAGENGLFGDEDQTAIRPAVEAAQAEGLGCEGPLPADTLFVQAVRGKYDLVVAMYHDQGHIPMKLLDFEHTINVSLGLPILRTSVDHGTAFDIAGQNRANPDSMKAALRLAAVMAQEGGSGG
jgi:4-hydroxythreonine-4-phosphate dehydrogenase